MPDNPPEVQDDETISGEEKLLRRVVPGRFNPADGVPESSTFEKDGDEVGTSVTLWLSDADLEAVIAGHEGFGVVAILASEAREVALGIVRTVVEGNPNHCELTGARTRGKRKQLAQKARWVVYPDDFPNALKKPVFTHDQ